MLETNIIYGRISIQLSLEIQKETALIDPVLLQE
jgi:hypothetical protein